MLVLGMQLAILGMQDECYIPFIKILPLQNWAFSTVVKIVRQQLPVFPAYSKQLLRSVQPFTKPGSSTNRAMQAKTGMLPATAFYTAQACVFGGMQSTEWGHARQDNAL